MQATKYRLIDAFKSLTSFLFLDSDELLCVEVPISNRGFPQPSDPDRIGYSPPAVVICVPRQSGYSSNTMLLLMVCFA